jgi:citrate synthase
MRLIERTEQAAARERQRVEAAVADRLDAEERDAIEGVGHRAYRARRWSVRDRS